jgi:hypothetical protein
MGKWFSTGIDTNQYPIRADRRPRTAHSLTAPHLPCTPPTERQSAWPRQNLRLGHRARRGDPNRLEGRHTRRPPTSNSQQPQWSPRDPLTSSTLPRLLRATSHEVARRAPPHTGDNALSCRRALCRRQIRMATRTHLMRSVSPMAPRLRGSRLRLAAIPVLQRRAIGQRLPGVPLLAPVPTPHRGAKPCPALMAASPGVLSGGSIRASGSTLICSAAGRTRTAPELRSLAIAAREPSSREF